MVYLIHPDHVTEVCEKLNRKFDTNINPGRIKNLFYSPIRLAMDTIRDEKTVREEVVLYKKGVPVGKIHSKKVYECYNTSTFTGEHEPTVTSYHFGMFCLPGIRSSKVVIARNWKSERNDYVRRGLLLLPSDLTSKLPDEIFK